MIANAMLTSLPLDCHPLCTPCRPNTGVYVSQEALLAGEESNAREWENQKPLMDMSEVRQETTLFDIFPRLDAPLRIDPPPSMKVSRVEKTVIAPLPFFHIPYHGLTS